MNSDTTGAGRQARRRHLEDLSGAEVTEMITESAVIIQPVGAVEQHGPHLPLSVDHVIAHEAAAALVSDHGDALDLWVLPTMSVSKSNEHAWSPGTLWLSAETMLAVLSDIGRCVATTAAKTLVFLNGHGGNTALLNVACRELRLAYGLKTFVVHPFVPADHGGKSPEAELGMGIHGGHQETSVFMHLRPELVRLDRATRNVPEHLAQNKYARFGGMVSFGWLSNDFGPEGHIGDPTTANAAEGKQLFEKAVDLLGEQLAEIASFTFRN